MEQDASKVVAIEHVTLDGVFQAPARPDEDARGGFQHGGWSTVGDDPQMQEVISRYMRGGWSLLVGRMTYEDMYEGWHVRQPSSPMTKVLTDVQKFVVCHDPTYNLPWQHSTLLAGNAAETVGKLKKAHDQPLLVFGSGLLVRSLMKHGLVDELVLMIHPLVLGEGRRFFDDNTPFIQLRLADQVTTKTGVLVATYQLASVAPHIWP